MKSETIFVRDNFPELISAFKRMYILKYAIETQPEWFSPDFESQLFKLENYIVETVDKYPEYPWLYHVADSCNRNNYLRYKRFYDRIKDITTNHTAFFCTHTFDSADNDRIFRETSELTRRKYVRRCCNSFNTPYVANIDFGGERGREHYHSIIQTDFIDNYNSKLWQYGNFDFEKIRSTDGSESKQFANYMRKLTLHGLKETAGRVIYSRLK